MRSIFRMMLLLVFLPLTLCAANWRMEVRTAYFHPRSEAVKDVYSSGWIDYQVEASKRICPNLEIWTGVNWMSKKGKWEDEGFYSRHRTKLHILPVSLGVKGVYPIISCFNLYLGAGVCYSFLHMESRQQEDSYELFNSYYHHKKHLSKNGVGLVAKTGFQWQIGKNCFLDFFADYFMQHFHVSRRDYLSTSIKTKHLNVGGYKLGLGFGVYF